MSSARLGLALFLMLSCSACSFHCGVGPHRAMIEQQIADGMHKKLGIKPSKVSCPGIGEHAELGKGPFTCTAFIEELEVPYTVTLAPEIPWRSDATFILTSTLEQKGAEAVKRADSAAVVTCPAHPRLRVATPGDEIECAVKWGQVNGWVLFRVTDAQGSITIRSGAEDINMGGSPAGVWVNRELITKALRDATRAETGREPAQVTCTGRGKLIEVPGGDTFTCTVTVDGTDVTYDMKATIATSKVSWKKREAAGAPAKE